MLGAIIGDVVGSVYEIQGWKSKEFPLFASDSRFTDDSVLTFATADAILADGDYRGQMQRWGRAFPNAGYGEGFARWLYSGLGAPYYSFGNGSAMRVSPVGFAFDSIETVLEEAENSAAVTHNHPEGIKGAQATALAVYLARTGSDKATIRREIATRFEYDLNRTLEDIRPRYTFDVTCQGSVPEAIIAFLDSADFEDAIRGAISLGGDADTQACIAGAIAEAYYGRESIPAEIVDNTLARLTAEMREVLERFDARFLRY